MKPLNIASVFARSSPIAPWTCTRCTLRSQTPRQLRGYATKGNYTPPKPPRSKRKGRIVFAATTGTLAASAFAFQDNVKHAYKAAERTGRVASALFVNINDYRVTLNMNEKLGEGGEEEQNRLLKACHQRCADRTLKVLEKNGSIFIKLGQHLVTPPTQHASRGEVLTGI